MKKRIYPLALLKKWVGLSMILSAVCLLAVPATAQSDDNDGFAVREDGAQPRAFDNGNTPASSNSDAPIRLARFTYVEGNVAFRVGENQAWSSATINLPIRQGAQVWVEGRGRAEIQFDDGSLLRMGSHALVTLQTLFSDMEGTFTEVKIHEGLVSLKMRSKLAVYQLDTPFTSVKAAGPGRIRAGVGTEVEVAIQQGEATLEGAQGSVRVREGDYVLLDSSSTPFRARRIPREDSWDRWNRDRDSMLDSGAPGSSHVPANIALVAGDLDSYGTWRQDDEYGQVWCPRVASSWRPYCEGRWVWVHPFGWTWVSSEPWGWAPYHYGTWVRRGWGWAWVPGPVTQCWSPAVVHYYYGDSGVVWVPLAPSEVYYPRPCAYTERMCHHFSILYAGVYFAQSNNTCAARPYTVNYINQTTYIDASTHYERLRPGTLSADRLNFWARNMKAGGSYASSKDFASGTGASFRATPDDARTAFARASVVSAPRGGVQPLSGPANLAPDDRAIAPSRILQTERQPRLATIERPIYRAQLPTKVERTIQSRSDVTSTSPSERLNNLRFGERSSQNSTTAPRVGSGNSTPDTNRITSTQRITTDIARGAERTTTTTPMPPARQQERPQETTDAQAARRARESVRGGGERRSSDTQAPAPSRNETPRRDTAPSPSPRPIERTEPPRRETAPAPRPIERTESPRRETAPAPRPIERTESPRREAPPAPAPRPIERSEPPRREVPSTPAPAPRYEPPQRRESPPPAPRQESPATPRERERGRGRG